MTSSGDPEADAQAEVDLDATVNEIDATFALDDNGGLDSEVDSDSDGHTENLDKTIMEGDIDQTIVVNEPTQQVRFTIYLKEGTAKLETWLTDSKKQETRGAFFIDVEAL